MSKFFFPKLVFVEALEPYRISTKWNTGETFVVDVEGILKNHKSLNSILALKVFKTVHIAEWGGAVEWFDTELGEDNIYARAKEQAGDASHEMFNDWMRKHGLSLTTAADVLGMSRRMVSYYRTAQKPIPKHVWLACLGWEAKTAGFFQEKHKVA